MVGGRASLFGYGLGPKHAALALGPMARALGHRGILQVMAGLRRNFALGPTTLFIEGGVGFGGGGLVDTGGGR